MLHNRETADSTHEPDARARDLPVAFATIPQLHLICEAQAKPRGRIGYDDCALPAVPGRIGGARQGH
jgi:hypothetical protein